MTAGCLFLVLIKLIRSKTLRQQKIPAVLFCIGILGYLFADWAPMSNYLAFYFFVVLAMSVPVSFWFLSQSLFHDEFRLRPWMGLVLVGFVVIQLTLNIISIQGLERGHVSEVQTLSIFKFALPLLFVVLGIVSAARGREGDLLTDRLQFRTYFMLLTAALMVLTLLSEIAFQENDAPVYLDLMQKIFIAFLTFLFASQRLQFKSGFFMVPEPAPSQAALKPELDSTTLEQLTELMDQQKYWRTEGLTIRKLAETMQVKEYKLRNTINQQLGYRNFNDYLHAYRIKEACKILSDPEEKDLTILEIAYDLGYNSLAPFNKAFKQITNMTPTEWRRTKSV